MSISAISASSATVYTPSTSSKKKTQDQDPMTQAISNLQSTDPTLASKLTDLQKKVDTMKKSGASEKDVQSTIKSTMEGLNSTDKSELKSAMPEPPAGARHGHGGPHSGPPPSSASSTSLSTDSSSDASSFSLTAILDSASSTQNDLIAGFMKQRSSASAL